MTGRVGTTPGITARGMGAGDRVMDALGYLDDVAPRAATLAHYTALATDPLPRFNRLANQLHAEESEED